MLLYANINSYALSVEENEKFMYGMHKMFSEKLLEYNKNINYIQKNVNHAILNIEDKKNILFLEKKYLNQLQSNNDLEIIYEKEIKINDNIIQPMCFVLYKPNSDLLQNYLVNTNLNLEDSIKYLSMHELAHCLYQNEKILLQKELNLNNREEELLADSFSLFMINDEQIIVNVLRNVIMPLESKDIHQNTKKLIDVLKILTKKEIDKKNIRNSFLNILNVVLEVVGKKIVIN